MAVRLRPVAAPESWRGGLRRCRPGPYGLLLSFPGLCGTDYEEATMVEWAGVEQRTEPLPSPGTCGSGGAEEARDEDEMRESSRRPGGSRNARVPSQEICTEVHPSPFLMQVQLREDQEAEGGDDGKGMRKPLMWSSERAVKDAGVLGERCRIRVESRKGKITKSPELLRNKYMRRSSAMDKLRFRGGAARGSRPSGFFSAWKLGRGKPLDLGLGQGPGQGPVSGLRQGALDLGAGPGVAVVVLAALSLVPVLWEVVPKPGTPFTGSLHPSPRPNSYPRLL
ncbi:hypothetical protein Cadr_000022089 [Camelus dromedarius]|uniref:Uncharacterized protein n=1 Tax=Camelus dromedarius TaxID=9838 RepID=A0A5N4CSW2_CAMDR|nr:hypothetical protein Cadr_000022089 [Camelus dromedarius]